jgi:serine/threonine-protein kinase
MPFVPGPDKVVGSKYRLSRRIAGGGMGSVWLARHLTLDVEVAVKLMSPLVADTPTALSRFEREAKASAQLKSRNIVKVQDYGVDDGTPFMVMELLEGEDLGNRLSRVGKLPLEDLAPLFSEICRGL